MKVFLVNGSPHQHGCTDRALREVASALEQGGIETEIFWIGNQPIGGCIGCGACAKLGRCAFDGVVNEFAEKLDEADGFVFGSPVHYAAASGSMTSFLDRLFYSAGGKMKGKPAAVVVSARRAGTTAAYEQLLKYGNSAEDVSALIDGSTSTKLCATGGVTVPLEFTFHYNAPTTASNYYISGANDDEGNPGRTLNSWELHGMNDQTGEWTLLDKQSDQTGWKNYEMRVFQLPEGPGYQHYKLKITKFNSNPGTIQFSGFGLTRSLVDGSFAGTTDAARTQHASMTTTLENDKLVISGHHEGNQSAQVYNVLYTGLNILVTENTRLVYNITPQQPLPNNKYDYDFYSMHLAVDLKFDDGTYLSDRGLEDENGVCADPNLSPAPRS